MADRRAHERRRPGWLYCTELADLGADGAMGVHHPLRVRRRSRRVRDEGRRGRVDGRRLRDRLVGNEVGEAEIGTGVVADDRGPFEVGQVGRHRVEVGDVIKVPERVGRDECLHPRAGEDVSHFLRAIEVHDRHDDRAEVRDRVERRGGFGPVRQLERDRVTGADAPSTKPGRDAASQTIDLTERAAVGPAIGHDAEVGGGSIVQADRQERAEGPVVPEPFAHVLLSALRRDCPLLELHGGSFTRPVRGCAGARRGIGSRTGSARR